ncbi:MAG TPA: S1C family serine protease [Candidatus Mediterraneibacter merdipullorum]|nr:S1C family serine protease [Candidatus Mediterraneibacter merdipullorum]
MPNDKEQDMNPEGPEEEKYSFLQETIKPKPISRQQLVRQLVRMAVYGVILGAFACLGFFALKPWIQDRFRGDLETVSIPEDEEPEAEEPAETQAEEETEEAVWTADAADYAQMLASMEERAEEAEKGLATIEPILPEDDWEETMSGRGSGVTGVIMADNGQELLILTDDSACSGAAEWTATFADGKRYSAALKKRDANTGFAVFSVSRGSMDDDTWDRVKVSVLGNSNLTSQGEVVMALGNMFGYPDGMSYGIVSSTENGVSFYDGECDVISTDIAATTGGTGVLFNLDGEVVGMISASVWDADAHMANAYAISGLKTAIETLANGESVPYIGIYGASVTQSLQDGEGMPPGVYVVDVDPDSPAMEAGIQSGDVICQVDGRDVGSMASYQSAVQETKTGRQIRVRGQRRGADGYVEVDFSVTVGSKE